MVDLNIIPVPVPKGYVHPPVPDHALPQHEVIFILTLVYPWSYSKFFIFFYFLDTIFDSADVCPILNLLICYLICFHRYGPLLEDSPD